MLDLQNNFSGRLGSDAHRQDPRRRPRGAVRQRHGHLQRLQLQAVLRLGHQRAGHRRADLGRRRRVRQPPSTAPAPTPAPWSASTWRQARPCSSPRRSPRSASPRPAGTRPPSSTGKSFEDVRQDAHDDWQETWARSRSPRTRPATPTATWRRSSTRASTGCSRPRPNATSTDGTYRGVDGGIHRADGYTHYDGWGTWDDFRKYSVLATMYPDMYADVVQSLVDLYADDANVGNATLSSRTHGRADRPLRALRDRDRRRRLQGRAPRPARAGLPGARRDLQHLQLGEPVPRLHRRRPRHDRGHVVRRLRTVGDRRLDRQDGRRDVVRRPLGQLQERPEAGRVDGRGQHPGLGPLLAQRRRRLRQRRPGAVPGRRPLPGHALAVQLVPLAGHGRPDHRHGRQGRHAAGAEPLLR